MGWASGRKERGKVAKIAMKMVPVGRRTVERPGIRWTDGVYDANREDGQ